MKIDWITTNQISKKSHVHPPGICCLLLPSCLDHFTTAAQAALKENAHWLDSWIALTESDPVLKPLSFLPRSRILGILRMNPIWSIEAKKMAFKRLTVNSYSPFHTCIHAVKEEFPMYLKRFFLCHVYFGHTPPPTSLYFPSIRAGPIFMLCYMPAIDPERKERRVLKLILAKEYISLPKILTWSFCLL